MSDLAGGIGTGLMAFNESFDRARDRRDRNELQRALQERQARMDEQAALQRGEDVAFRQSQAESAAARAERDDKLAADRFEYQKEQDRKNLALKYAELAGKKNEQVSGRPVPAGDVANISGADFAIKSLSGLSDEYNKSFPEGGGKVSGLISGLLGSAQIGERGRSAASYDVARKSTAQTVGRFLEGGKMTDADVLRYEKMLPSASDSLEVAEKKRTYLQGLIAAKQKSDIEGLKGAGYSTGGLKLAELPKEEARQAQGMIKEARADQRPQKVFQNGFEYILNPQTGQYE